MFIALYQCIHIGELAFVPMVSFSFSLSILRLSILLAPFDLNRFSYFIHIVYNIDTCLLQGADQSCKREINQLKHRNNLFTITMVKQEQISNHMSLFICFGLVSIKKILAHVFLIFLVENCPLDWITNHFR